MHSAFIIVAVILFGLDFLFTFFPPTASYAGKLLSLGLVFFAASFYAGSG